MSWQRLLMFLLAFSLTSVGCDGEPTTTTDSGTPPRTDAGGPDGSTPDDPDGGSPDGSTPDDPTEVTVKRGLRYHTAAGVETVADTSAPPELFILDGTSLRRIDGAATDEGNHRFTGIPAGTPYYLKSGLDYVVTDARVVDLSLDVLGRPDAGLASDSGDVAALLDVSGLEPLTSERRVSLLPPFELISDEVAFLGYLYPDMDLSPGQSTYAGEGRLYNSAPGFPRFIAERGDRAWVNQFAPRETGPLPDGGTLGYEAVVRSLQLPPFSHDDGTPLEVRGAFQPAPMTDISLDWRLSAFAAHAPAAHPGATSSTSDFVVFPAAYGLEYGWVGNSGELLALNLPRGTTEDLALPLSHGNPFPSTWGVVGRATHGFRYPATLSNGAAVTLGASIESRDRMPALVAGAIVPRISPPRGLAIDGQDAYVARELEGSPVVSWTPPELGAPSLYTLRLVRFDDPLPGSTQPRSVIVARFHLPGAARAVQLPAGILQPGKDHLLGLVANTSPGVDLSSAPLVTGNRIPLYSASTVSAVLTTP
ncbi:hypothetical protein ACLESO_09685 [Pyxidicoccus sp. 3LG]